MLAIIADAVIFAAAFLIPTGIVCAIAEKWMKKNYWRWS